MIIHIGYPKSASSHIQEKLFKLHPEINYLNVEFPCEIYENIYFLPLDQYDTQSNLALRKIYVDENLSNARINVVADERFAGFFLNYDIVSERLKNLFPEAKIFVIIRSQATFLRSLYDMHQYNYSDSKKRWLPLDKWLESYMVEPYLPFFKSLFYDEVIEHYQALFGKNNVEVFLFEEIKKNDSQTLFKRFSFLGIKDTEKAINLLKMPATNTAGNHSLYRLKLRFLPFIRFSSFIPHRVLKRIDKSKKRTEITPFFDKKVAEIFADTNKNLAEMLGRDLCKFKYPM